jgi:hypothetical protein
MEQSRNEGDGRKCWLQKDGGHRAVDISVTLHGSKILRLQCRVVLSELLRITPVSGSIEALYQTSLDIYKPTGMTIQQYFIINSGQILLLYADTLVEDILMWYSRC